MKRLIIGMITGLIPLFGFSQNQQITDDIYFKPSDAKNVQNQTVVAQQTPNYKNGAKEIIYIDRKNGKNVVVQRDTVQILAQANDSTENMQNDSSANNQQNGYYLNGFNGSESDLEYAERIRHFHDPKYQIFIGDPRYNDLFFLDNNDWNVYLDGSYAYVTPTWTNPYWWNYNLSPFSYWNNWYNPWGYNGMYGGFGFGGYYGFDGFYGYGMGYPFGYGGYGGYGYGYGYGYPYGYGNYGYGYGYGSGYANGLNYNPNHDEANRREINNATTPNVRLGGTSNAASSRINAGGIGSQNPYTVVSGAQRRNSSSVVYNSNSIRSVNPSGNSVYSTRINGIGLVRTGNFRSSYSPNTTYISRTINTSPRTISSNVNSNVSIQRNESNSYRNSENVSSGRSSYYINNENRSSTPEVYRSNSNSSFSSGSLSTPSYSGGGGGGSRSSSGRR